MTRWLWPGGIVVPKCSHAPSPGFFGKQPKPPCFELSGPWTPGPATDLSQENVQIAHSWVYTHSYEYESTCTRTTLQMYSRIPGAVPGFLAKERCPIIWSPHRLHKPAHTRSSLRGPYPA